MLFGEDSKSLNFRLEDNQQVFPGLCTVYISNARSICPCVRGSLFCPIPGCPILSSGPPCIAFHQLIIHDVH